MPSPPIADAALLAASAPQGGLAPRDMPVAAAWLDLRDDAPAVALPKLRAVAQAFGPSLFLQEGFRLFVTTGRLAPDRAAATLGETLVADAPLVAVVRGEDLTARLEELSLAGCDLGIRDEPAPLAAWAPAPQRVLGDALRGGAVVVVCRFATAASVHAAFEESPAEPDTANVTLWWADAHQLVAPLLAPPPPEATLRDAARGCDASLDSTGGVPVLTLRGASRAVLAEAARRVALACPAGSFARPPEEGITPVLRERVVQVPASHLEYALDTRPAPQWREA